MTWMEGTRSRKVVGMIRKKGLRSRMVGMIRKKRSRSEKVGMIRKKRSRLKVRVKNKTPNAIHEHQGTDITVCFRTLVGDPYILAWSMLKISTLSLCRLSLALRLENHAFTGTRSGFHLCYTEHKHVYGIIPSNEVDESKRFFYSHPSQKLMGPPAVTNYHWLFWTASAVVGSTIYCLGGDRDDYSIEYPEEVDIMGICHMPQCCNLKDQVLHWKAGPRLLSPRLYPKLVSLDGKLFVFAGNFGRKPFAEVYDPSVGNWEALPEPSPITIDVGHDLFAIPLSNSTGKILVFSLNVECEHVLDTHQLEWEPFPPKAKKQLSDLMRYSILDYHEPVVLENTIYWFDKSGMLCAFDFHSGTYFRGPIIGNRREHMKTDRVLLLALEGFLAMIWDQSHDTEHHIHLAMLSLAKIPTTNALTAYIVACFCLPVSHRPEVQGAYLLGM